MQFHEKKKWFTWFHEFFAWTVFKFSGPLCESVQLSLVYGTKLRDDSKDDAVTTKGNFEVKEKTFSEIKRVVSKSFAAVCSQFANAKLVFNK